MSKLKRVSETTVTTTKNFTVVIAWEGQKAHIRPYGKYGAEGRVEEKVLSLVNPLNSRLKWDIDKETGTCEVSIIDVAANSDSENDHCISCSNRSSHNCVSFYYNEEKDEYHYAGWESPKWDSIDAAFYGCERRMREHLAHYNAYQNNPLLIEMIEIPVSKLVMIDTAEIVGNIWLGFTNPDGLDNRRYDGTVNMTFGRNDKDNIGVYERNRMEYHRWLAQFTNEEKEGLMKNLIHLENQDGKVCVIEVKGEGCAVVTSNPVYVESINNSPTGDFILMLDAINRYLSAGMSGNVSKLRHISNAIHHAFDAIYVQREYERLDVSDCNFK